jgi:hypothetical protein
MVVLWLLMFKISQSCFFQPFMLFDNDNKTYHEQIQIQIFFISSIQELYSRPRIQMVFISHHASFSYACYLIMTTQKYILPPTNSK